MRRGVIVGLCLLLGAVVMPGVRLPSASATPAEITVSGDGVGSYPAFDPTILRYAVTTTAETGGALSVTVPPGSTVDGVPASGTVPVTGLAEGDEVSVGIGGTSYAFVYLPPDFPTLTVTTHQAGLAAGYVGLGLTTFGAGAVFDTLIDRNGVPAWFHRGAGSDLKRQPNGDLTTFRPTTATSDHTGSDLVTLDEQFREVGRQRVVDGLTDTDNHDAVKLSDGSTILIGYEPRGEPVTGYLDATIQKVDSQGNVVFQWSSQGLEAETLNPLLWPVLGDQRTDYAHINSVQEIADGTHDLLVSFRHFSSVYRIATEDHGSVHQGDIVWRLGGRHSDFGFVNDPDQGPCAQHTANMLLDQADGHDHVLVFDNGSGALGQSAAGCVDPNAPSGAGIERRHTRIAEWSLDTTAHTATLMWSYSPTVSDPDPRDPFSFFAGSARRLANGDTLIGWADERAMLASEVKDEEGGGTTLLWQVETPDTGSHTTRYATYRASLIDYADDIDPTATLQVPGGPVYVDDQAPVVPTWSCTDRGGSNLASCSVTGLVNGHLATTPGVHTVSVTARDGASPANTDTVNRTYTVRRARQPDGLVRKAGSSTWKGGDVYGGSDQTVKKRARRRHTVKSFWKVQNDGARSDAFVLAGTARSHRFRVRYFSGGSDVTAAVVAGTYRTATLTPGSATVLRVEVRPTRRARIGRSRVFRLHSASAGDATTDTVATRVTVRR